MIKSHFLPIILSLLMMAGCNNKETSIALATDSTRKAPSIQHEDSAALFSREFSGWMDSTLGKPINMPKKLTLEEHWQEQNLDTRSFDNEPGFFTNYQEVLRWSPDSNYVLDFGSYGSVLVKDDAGKTRVEAGEPDTELSLINIKGNQRTRLMFVGPSSQILDAKCINTSEAVIIGTFDKTGAGNLDTLLWMIDVKDKYFRLYNVKEWQDFE